MTEIYDYLHEDMILMLHGAAETFELYQIVDDISGNSCPNLRRARGPSVEEFDKIAKAIVSFFGQGFHEFRRSQEMFYSKKPKAEVYRHGFNGMRKMASGKAKSKSEQVSYLSPVLPDHLPATSWHEWYVDRFEVSDYYAADVVEALERNTNLIGAENVDMPISDPAIVCRTTFTSSDERNYIYRAQKSSKMIDNSMFSRAIGIQKYMQVTRGHRPTDSEASSYFFTVLSSDHWMRDQVLVLESVKRPKGAVLENMVLSYTTDYISRTLYVTRMVRESMDAAEVRNILIRMNQTLSVENEDTPSALDGEVWYRPAVHVLPKDTGEDRENDFLVFGVRTSNAFASATLFVNDYLDYRPDVAHMEKFFNAFLKHLDLTKPHVKVDSTADIVFYHNYQGTLPLSDPSITNDVHEIETAPDAVPVAWTSGMPMVTINALVFPTYCWLEISGPTDLREMVSTIAKSRPDSSFVVYENKGIDHAFNLGTTELHFNLDTVNQTVHLNGTDVSKLMSPQKGSDSGDSEWNPFLLWMLDGLDITNGKYRNKVVTTTDAQGNTVSVDVAVNTVNERFNNFLLQISFGSTVTDGLETVTDAVSVVVHGGEKATPLTEAEPEVVEAEHAGIAWMKTCFTIALDYFRYYIIEPPRKGSGGHVEESYRSSETITVALSRVIGGAFETIIVMSAAGISKLIDLLHYLEPNLYTMKTLVGVMLWIGIIAFVYNITFDD